MGSDGVCELGDNNHWRPLQIHLAGLLINFELGISHQIPNSDCKIPNTAVFEDKRSVVNILL